MVCMCLRARSRRSLRQLKRQVADRLAAKQAEVESEDEGEDGEQYIGTSVSVA